MHSVWLHVTETKNVFVCVSLAATFEDCDFYLRFFAPWVGIDEDPVTGSAYSVAGKHHVMLPMAPAMQLNSCPGNMILIGR